MIQSCKPAKTGTVFLGLFQLSILVGILVYNFRKTNSKYKKIQKAQALKKLITEDDPIGTITYCY